MRLLNVCGYAILVLFLVSCNYTEIKDPSVLRSNNKDSSLLKKSSVLSWDLVRTNVLRSCMNCHVGHTNPELGNISSIRQNLAKVLSEVQTDSMPPQNNGYPNLDNCKKEILNRWAAQNAPEFSTLTVGEIPACQNLPDSNPDNPPNLPIAQMPLTYDTLVNRILQPRCLKCHNKDSDDLEAAGVLFFPYQEILNRPHLWSTPGNQSKIVHSLTNDEGDERMPPATDSAPLSQDEIQFITRWIDAGKPQ